MSKIILDLCGGTGAWSKPYRDNGYDVKIITLPKQDICLYIPPKNVYGILAAPPCTHLAGSGARWWKEKGDKVLLEALSIVDACLRIMLIGSAGAAFWVLENPVGRLSKYLWKPDLIFNPCDYGDPYTKKTCLWGQFNIPKKKPVTPIKACKQGSHLQKLGGKSTRTKLLRSITPQGFAQAFYEANK